MADSSNVVLGNTRKNVGDPNAKYDSLKGVYRRNRAALSGERYVKDLDRRVSPNNLLLPFSPSMDQMQYEWYKAESEWPGFTEQYARTIVGGLLRKPPQVSFVDSAGVPEEALEWLRNDFTRENGSLVSFLDQALWEEMNTSRAFVCVNYPVTNPDDFTPEELQPYPILLAGESIINWSTGINSRSNKEEITRLVIRMFRSRQSDTNEYHDDYIDTTWVHQLDDQGYYEIIVYEQSKEASADTPVIAGRIQQDYPTNGAGGWTEVERETNILRNGERLDYIPIFPFNGSIDAQEPLLTGLINREVGLYNRVSRRNHLLYGSAAYTPVITADGLTDDQKDEIVDQGLGSWMFLPEGAEATILSAPTEALQDLDRAIEATLMEMSKMGIRILAPEGTSGESGVALEIRNAAQTAQLATMNHKVSEQMKQIIVTMVNWRYNLEITEEDVNFQLSADFNPAPLGEGWMRLVSEWYQSGIISKEVFIEVAKQNDILPADYDDEAAQEDIENDPAVVSNRETFEATMAAAEAAASGDESS